MKIIRLALFSITFFLFSQLSGDTQALCGGWAECCQSVGIVYSPAGCDPMGCAFGDPNCTECTGPTSTTCTSTISLICDEDGPSACKLRDTTMCKTADDYNPTIINNCQPLAPPTCTTGPWVDRGCGGGSCPSNQMWQTRTATNCPAGTITSQCINHSSCGTTPPPPPPDPTTCTGWCASGIANCGANGWDSATGTCPAGSICCKERSNFTWECPFSWHDTTVAGGCKLGPDRYCSDECRTHAGDPNHPCQSNIGGQWVNNACASGTVRLGDWCYCPGVCPTGTFNQSSYTLNIGSSVLTSLVISNPGRYVEYYDMYVWNPSRAVPTPQQNFLDTTAPYQLTLTGAIGHTTTVRAKPKLTRPTLPPNSTYYCPDIQADVCIRSNWVAQSCGGGSCLPSEVYETRAQACGGATNRCRYDSVACPTCDIGPWVNRTCGGTNSGVTCGPLELLQTRAVQGDSCTAESARCLSETDSASYCQTSWFQTRGGPAYARKTFSDAIFSRVPVACYELNNSAICRAAITAFDLFETPLSDGIPMSGGGNIRANNFYSERMDNTRAEGTMLTHRKYIYDYFVRYTSLRRNPEPYNYESPYLVKPTAPAADGTTNYYATTPALYDYLTIREPWVVTADEQIVVFIEGDLVLDNQYGETQLTSVEEGGFLAFLVKGDIIIRDNLGNTTLNDTANTNLEGVFIADGTITVESTGDPDTELQLVAAGTYVGHQTVVLERALPGEDNALNPAEIFIYRPDFVRYMPDWMTKPHIIWQETN